MRCYNFFKKPVIYFKYFLLEKIFIFFIFYFLEQRSIESSFVSNHFFLCILELCPGLSIIYSLCFCSAGLPPGKPSGSAGRCTPSHLPRPAVQAAVCTAVVHENRLSEPCALRALRSVVPCGADVALFTAEGQRPHPQNDRSL